MFLRLRDCDTGTYFIVDTTAGKVCADLGNRGSVGWAGEPDATLASGALESARRYEECFARAVPGTDTPDRKFHVRGPLTQAEQAALAQGREVATERPALQLHLDFFDPDLDGWISWSENYGGWRGLGFSRLAALLKAFLSALLFGQLGATRFMAIDITRLTPKRYASTGIFEAQGGIDNARLQMYLAEFDAAPGERLSFEQTIALLQKHSPDGIVSRSQFRSLFDVCRRLNGNAEVITKAQFRGLFDGSLLWHAASMTNNAGRRAPWLQPSADLR